MKRYILLWIAAVVLLLIYSFKTDTKVEDHKGHSSACVVDQPVKWHYLMRDNASISFQPKAYLKLHVKNEAPADCNDRLYVDIPGRGYYSSMIQFSGKDIDTTISIPVLLAIIRCREDLSTRLKKHQRYIQKHTHLIVTTLQQ